MLLTIIDYLSLPLPFKMTVVAKCIMTLLFLALGTNGSAAHFP